MFGCHVYSDGLRVSVFGGGDGLVQPVCAGLGAFDDAGYGILRQGAAASSGHLEAGDLQYGPRSPVYKRGVCWAVGGGGDPDQHGWSRPGLRQHLCGEAVAVGEIRRGLPQGIPSGW